jgi:murein DD-endopeptidase MepM/ murein hydrolase activator NlpD
MFARIFFIFFVLIFFPLHAAFSQPSNLSISTLKDPIPVNSNTNQLLVYELHFYNSGEKPIRIDRIEVYDQANKRLSTYVGNTLKENNLVYKNGKSIKSASIELEKNMGAFVYYWLAFDKSHPAPPQLRHKIWAVSVNEDKSLAEADVFNYIVPVNNEKPVVLGFPVSGYNWIMEAASAPFSYHRRAILPKDGKFYLAQRYAIDFSQLCPDGREVQGNMRKNNNWSAYGHPIFAAADGVVSKIQTNNVPDNTPPGFPNPPASAENSSGNYVITKIAQNGKNYYVLYAHMQPGSLKVQLGEKVTKGQFIGLLGNSGNSSAPHMHLQVSDANDPLKSEGVPFVFSHSTLQGTAGEVNMDYGIWVPPIEHKTELVNTIPTADQVYFVSHEYLKKCRR